MENSCALILAGGKGKRMGSAMPKVLFKDLLTRKNSTSFF